MTANNNGNVTEQALRGIEDTKVEQTTHVEERRVTAVAAQGQGDESGPPLGRRFVDPSKEVIDRIWTIAIVAFAIVLVGSFLTLALSTFREPQNENAPQLMLTMFTAVLGFLAGLFTPSPGSRG